MQVIHIGGNPGAVGVEPGAWADSVPGVDGIGTLGAEIGAPREVPLVDVFRQALADGISAR